MSTKAQVKTQAKMPAAPGPVHAGQPPLVMPERASERPDIATQLEGAARLGHSLGAIRITSAAPSQIQAQPLIQRQPVPEGEEDEEELQMQREMADIQRQELPEEEQEEELQMMSDIPRMGLEGGPVAPDVEAAIQRARGGGQPLDSAVQAQMGETLGYDFSDVRVHTDAQADALNQQLSARAFTTGRDLFFRNGAYDPRSSSSRELLAHELTHVVQQSTGQVRGSGSSMIIRPAGDIFEQEADEQNKRIEKPGNSPRYQRLVDNLSVGGFPGSTVERSSLGNQVVQRALLFDPENREFTAGGKHVEMTERMVGANCHGYTYGTWDISAEGGGLNPEQSPKGVGIIVENEAGGEKEVVKRTIRGKDNTFDQEFIAKPKVGNLIVVDTSTDYAHSAEVTRVEGKKFSKVFVNDKQGAGGVVEERPLVPKKGWFGKIKGIGVSQLANNSTVHLYEKTPKATKSSTK